MTYNETLNKLYNLKDEENVIFRDKKFGIKANNALGIYHKDLKIIAKEIGRNNELAVQLFNSGIYEGRLLCSKIFRPQDLTEHLMEKWVITFENWEICDSFSMGLFAKSKFALAKILEWTERKPEFEKRAGFTIMASYCMVDKKADNSLFEQFLPIIKREANDGRLYVKKAINWALRSVGKRNKDLKKIAIKTSNELLEYNSPSANWIAKNALAELQKTDVRLSDYPRKLYRNLELK